MCDGMSGHVAGAAARSSSAKVNVPDSMGAPQRVMGSKMVKMDMYLRARRGCRDIERSDLAADAYRTCRRLCLESTEERAAYTKGVFRQGYEAAIQMEAIFPENIFNNVGNFFGHCEEHWKQRWPIALQSVSPRNMQTHGTIREAQREREALLVTLFNATFTFVLVWFCCSLLQSCRTIQGLRKAPEA